MQKHTGLIALLDDESSRPTATDAALLEKFHTHQKHPHYVFTKQSVLSSFGISHYAGTVRSLTDRVQQTPSQGRMASAS